MKEIDNKLMLSGNKDNVKRNRFSLIKKTTKTLANVTEQLEGNTQEENLSQNK